ncbi:hypothetical protein Sfulv_38020 [Streptomyces fulvorobeus]|uniref:Uncharacterized protein n=1 Tax=Streptomyces fulvorobeus TaxID=284028 RepID=A0A7J0C942_9ACTN|nr:hypothetical protein Sfulv_38020 [Streptomyces fulvorobeus]
MNRAPIAYRRRSSGSARCVPTVLARAFGLSGPGVKCRALGIRRRKATAQNTASIPTAPRAARHPHSWATQPVTIRPLMPPMLLPATNRPIAAISAFGRTSSARYAIADAGTPASAAPWTARRAISQPRDGAKGMRSPISAATASDAVIIRRRPKRSERALSGSTHSASAPVAAETVQLACPAVAPNEAETAGSTAWVE